jgi:hypothetical protein
VQCVVFCHVLALVLCLFWCFVRTILYLQNNVPRVACFRGKMRLPIYRRYKWCYADITPLARHQSAT